MKANWHYFRAGSVERGARYEWREGYSRAVEGGTIYPWLTKREAQRAAKAEGARAVFHKTEAAARLALEADDRDAMINTTALLNRTKR